MGRQINFRIWHFLAEGKENRADILATTPREGTCALGHVKRGKTEVHGRIEAP